MRRSSFSASFIVVLASGALCSAAVAERPVVAVFAMDIDDRIGLAAPDRAGLDELLHTQLARAGTFEVVPRHQVRRALLAEKRASYASCYAEACQIEVGSALAASKTVAGSIRKIGSVCTVNLRLLDLRKETAEGAASVKSDCAPDRVVAALERAVGDLVGVAGAPPEGGGEPPPVSPAPSPPMRPEHETEPVLDVARQDAMACYERARRWNPDLEGEVTADFTIGEDGRVLEVEVDAPTDFQRAGIAPCISKAVRRLRFSRAEEVTRARLPFAFRPVFRPR